jgi:hypothetical protein
MNKKTDDPPLEDERSAKPAERLEDPSADEFEVTIQPDEGDPDRFHITSISPRPRQ